ncbi:HAD-IB family phosphatase [Chitinimonas sp. BJYL2]|uniref:HAD-IB family phosphatase n=1 Tax=Chitinimonas sp. BJYL2 TaxID=2976696 RepID=UPI0022B35BF2|nr:HAD-IB family phosphatase [Chitinimonas sp. BJYL2]
MLTVAIPALNEAENIQTVIRFALTHPAVTKVVVVDDGSIDDTVMLARAAGAHVITSTLLGKGPSMRDALTEVHTDFVLYLDADMRRLDPALIDRMLAPLHGGADFVKARFSRASGRVTELTARPLLKTLFPELSAYGQPLGGIMAARTELLTRLHFEDDFGVDVGLLIDAHFMGAAVVEVDVGLVEHDSKPLDQLGKMAIEVSRAILRRAEMVGRLKPELLLEIMEHERQLSAEIEVIAHAIEPGGKLALFDMDGTLLEGRFIEHLAAAAGLDKVLAELLDHHELDAATRTASIARALQGVPKDLFVKVAKSIPLQAGAVEAVVALRRQGYRVGLVTDSYFIAADIVRKRVFADFAVAHVLSFSNGEATGEIRINDLFRHEQGCMAHPICKRNVLVHLEDFSGMPFRHSLMVGDGDNDICLIRSVHQGFAYRPRSPLVRMAGLPLTHLGELGPQVQASTGGMRVTA